MSKDIAACRLTRDRFQRQPPKSLRKKSEKKKGAQPGHQDHHLQMVETPDVLEVYKVGQCHWCSHSLASIPGTVAERRQVVDMPFIRLHITQHQVEGKQCPHCLKLSRASFPFEVNAPIQYGNRLAALAVYLVEYQLLPLARTSSLLRDVLGVSLSPGTIWRMIGEISSRLEAVEEQIKTALSGAKVIHQDETSIYVNGKPQWVHVCSTKTLTHYGLHARARARGDGCYRHCASFSLYLLP